MSWQPKQNVIDIRSVTDNLFAYFAAHQTERLTWANNGAPLPDIQTFYKSGAGRVITIFPALVLLNKSVESDLTEDLLKAEVKYNFGVMLSGGNTDDLVSNAEKYAMALESMLANITRAELTANALFFMIASVDALATRFDEVHPSQTRANAYLQIFTTRVSYTLRESSY